MRSATLLLVFVGCTSSEWVRSYEGFLPGTERSTTCVFLVRDKRTGRPVPGARVRQHKEWMLGADGRWAPLVAEAHTDEYGLVAFELPEDPGSCHWAIDAPGYAPTEEYGGVGMQLDVDLERGWEQAGRLLGPRGEPLADIEVEYKVGCAHAPALRTTRTDTEGVFVFDNVTSGDITLEGPGFEADYWGGEPTRPRRWGIPSYQVLPGGTLRGRVLDVDGTAPEFAVIQSDTSPRGPRAVADGTGRFVVLGATVGGRLFLHTGNAVETIDAGEYRPEGPVLIRLGDEGGESIGWKSVHVSLVDEQGARPERLCEVFLDRVEDGRRWSAEWSPWQEGPTELRVPPGEYVLSVGEDWSAFVADRQALSVTGPTRTTVTVHRQPILEVDVPEVERDPVSATRILFADRHWGVELGDTEDPVYLPAKGSAWLRVDLAGGTHTFAIGPTHDGRRVARVELPGLKRLVFPELSRPCSVYVLYGDGEEVEQDESEGPTLDTYATGSRWVVAWHEQRGRAIARVELPWSASEPIEVSGLEFTPHPTAQKLRVLDPEGRAVMGASVEVLDDPSPPGYDFSNWQGADETDELGVFRHPYLRAGAHVRIDVEGYVPCWERLEGDPPYVVRLGSGTIEVDLRGLPEASVVMDGWMWPSWRNKGPSLVLRGVKPGAHTLLVGAKGKTGQAHRMMIRDGDVRRLQPTLRARPGK